MIPTGSGTGGNRSLVSGSLVPSPSGEGNHSSDPDGTVLNPTGSQPKKEPEPHARTSRRQAWRCHTCDQRLTSWAGAERHADSHGGARLDLELNPPTDRLDFDDDHQRTADVHPKARFL